VNKLKGHIYDLITWAAQILGRRNLISNKILILRVDEIGDYILWRKYLGELIQSDLCKGKELHFMGNASWKNLFDLEYGKQFEKIIWLQKNNFKTKVIYRFAISRMLFTENYQIVINPILSRAKRVDDSLVKAAKAPLNYGFVRNNENYLSYENNYDKHLYQHLLEVKERPVFEFRINQIFTEWVCKKSIFNLNLNFEPSVLPQQNLSLPTKGYFIVFPGSRSSNRIWNTENFVEVSNYLYQTYKLTAIVCGGPGDIIYAEKFIQAYANPVINITGKTSLPELLSVIKNADCLLSVDTGSIHLAASVNCFTLGIFNGAQYGRFSPYPKEISSKIISFYPKKVLEDINKNELMKYELIVNISYNEVSSKEVIDYLAAHPISKEVV
jgi:ADP-heptose:LPS heptosyltransferase